MSLHYRFPVIKNIMDVLPHIQGCDEFIVADKGEYVVINYLMQTTETFPSVEGPDFLTAAMRRECRGLIFDKAGNVLSRRFHKFFNNGERADSVVDLSKPHVILEKLDGSMISPIKLSTGIRWTTKMGITNVSMQAEEFVARNPHYVEFAQYMIDTGRTPIFEWCSRKQRIVLDYPQDQLILTAVRENKSGEYSQKWLLDSLGKQWNIPIVGEFDVSKANLDDLRTYIKSLENVEGVVTRFDNGHMVKDKSTWYVTIHRAKSLIENERDVVKIVLDEQVDDLLPLLDEEDKDRLRLFQEKVFLDLNKFAHQVNEHLILNKCVRGYDRKQFALNNSGLPSAMKSCIFSMYDDTVEDTLNKAFAWGKSFLYKSCSSNTLYSNKSRAVLLTAVWKGSYV